jgi:hypothetical protein
MDNFSSKGLVKFSVNFFVNNQYQSLYFLVDFSCLDRTFVMSEEILWTLLVKDLGIANDWPQKKDEAHDG